MRIRPAAVAALLVATVFGAAACGPEGSGSDGAAAAPSRTAVAPSAPAGEPSAGGPDPAATASAGKGAGSAAPGAADADNGGRGPNCKEYFKTHKVVRVRTVDKGTGKLTADSVEANCSPNGLFFNPDEKPKPYTVSPDAKITVYTDESLKTRTVTVRSGTAGDGLAHVKTCAESNHATDPDSLPKGYFCYQDMYEYTVDAKGAITSLKETWSS
ncbi:hypothetical protein [Kitasatospora sp. DSM 101779]|uniref:hypothetical protein n=1 Tax=Kitasatospora sp. DSM 101779 TaxID=2853165 RepID=UPI0021D8101F|nr:hypothetical protein [Kitasatospora sp. DSM 101779]MCU7823507.1 hypothetical protein [Kitasatospora sp. DSM 101779]